MEAALASYVSSLEISERLAASDPSNAVWQRDLIVGLVKASEVTGDLSYAGQALDVALRMRSLGVLAPADEWMIEDLRRRAGR